MKTIALIVAGGAGLRAAADTTDDATQAPKQFRDVAGRMVIERAVSPFLVHDRIDAVLAVVRSGWEDPFRKAIGTHQRLLEPVPGGDSRQDSVRLGLEALAGVSPDQVPDLVLIHDAARPFVTPAQIDRVLDGLNTHPGAIPATAVSDTLKRAGASGAMIDHTVDRAGLYAVQTPQGFAFPLILKAHKEAATLDREFTDDASIAEWAGLDVALVAGDHSNRKLTTPEDFELAEKLYAPATETRVGSGYDVHRFADGDAVTLCGVRIPHDQRLSGHSDADVGLHALTDALLGAIADGDIGSHFPPSDPKWRGADSEIFLRHAADLVRVSGTIVSVDVTVICEAPRVGPHRDAMRQRIAEILSIALNRVAVKATTSEGLGFTGRREGIAAQALATIALPVQDEP